MCLGNPHGPCGNLLFLLAGCDSFKCHRGQPEMPGLYLSSFRERDQDDVKDICIVYKMYYFSKYLFAMHFDAY